MRELFHRLRNPTIAAINKKRLMERAKPVATGIGTNRRAHQVSNTKTFGSLNIKKNCWKGTSVQNLSSDSISRPNSDPYDLWTRIQKRKKTAQANKGIQIEARIFSGNFFRTRTAIMLMANTDPSGRIRLPHPIIKPNISQLVARGFSIADWSWAKLRMTNKVKKGVGITMLENLDMAGLKA